jgi:Tol biopolymer transport system component
MPLTSGENVTQTTISHDGKYFAYVDYDGQYSRLRLQAVDQSSRAEIMPPLEAPVLNLSFSPDDRQLYYVISGSSLTNNGLYRIPVKGGLPTKLLDTVTSPVSFSLSSNEMLFVRANPEDGTQQQIVTTSADGSGERVLLTSEKDRRLALNAAWSPDGRSVVFGSINRQFPSLCSLMKLDLNDGSIAALTDEKWDSCYRVAFTHDGGGVAFVGTKQNDAFSTRRDQVYFLEIGSHESRRLTGDGNWHDPMSMGITDDNEIIALPLNRVSELWTIDPNGNAASAEQITQGQSDGRGGIVPTADGKVAFLARDGDGFAIFETDANGQDRRRVVGAPTMQELRADPQARFFVYSQQEGNFTQLFRTDRSGSDHRQLTFGNSSKIDSTVSPDGKWVAFADTVFDGTNVIFSLQRIPAEGGTPEMLSHEYCGVPHYSNDGKYISCSLEDKIRILSADTGELVSELAVETPFVSNSGARWSPDDKELVYRVIKNGATNLWHQSVAGRQPEPLTKFAKGEVYNFAYSSDGKKIYLSRGTQIRNAVIIRNFR